MAENRAVVIREQGWCGADCNGVGRIFGVMEWLYILILVMII